MSDATYRIDTEHHPDPNSSDGVQWLARVVRLSDGLSLTTVWASDENRALSKARAFLWAQNVQQDGRSLFVDDEGEPVEGHSVKA